MCPNHSDILYPDNTEEL